MIIAIGNDHIVTDYKVRIVDFLKNKGYQVIDVGTHDHIRTHYPIYGLQVADLVRNGEADFGVVICGTGVGISTAANKNQGIRAALVSDPLTAKYVRQELNANIISVGGAVVGEHIAQEIIETFITTEYQPTEENKQIIQKISDLEQDNPEQHNNPNFFDKELQLWCEGYYHD
ncbi:galactose-6-phosphate isomerase lacB subunit [Granulicatella balaenopterae]|uniref:Galactose-6-phosphate isomerase lacB subunit n=1 Tax=Granulicatella balaenopterae TaxID=137733 RepID=A0A1H9LLG3_9LACT|nr:galactose-6-phosphate isomerase subunit LacB [Granulicatella balaenopterae]SER11965.1 galactose-6-phosphate isomerase lacB subunit [Granulicatella balaenopterae]